jgi:Transmembrane secretion effector
MAGRSLFIDVTPLRRSRDFRLLWLAQLATASGRQIVIVTVAYQVYLLGVFQAVPIVAAGLYGGALADRLDRRRLQLAGKSVVVLGSLVLAVGALGLRAPVALVYGVVAVTAAASTLDQTARTATVPRVVPRDLLPSAMSLSQVLVQTAAIVGPALAGLIVSTAGVSWAYVADAIGFVPAALLTWRLSPQPPASGHPVVLGWRAPAEAIRYVARNRLVVGIFAADLAAMTFGMPTAIFPALALGVLGIGPRGLGLLYAAPAVGALVASLLSGWVRRIRRQGRAVFVAIAVWGAAIAAFGVASAGRAIWLALAMLALAGAGDMVSAIFRQTILQLSIPDGMRGRMSAFHMMVVTTGPRLGDLEAGAVAALAGPVLSVVSGGVACVVGVAVLAALLPEMRTQRTAPARLAAAGEAA